ncbi:MAG TPA: T9SS type A sorting domain-containing protein [Ignavibacteriaceae bacterium]|nr:T9SS type A sorting domain-containing protein [Ignavibacteriaceae bacterium]
MKHIIIYLQVIFAVSVSNIFSQNEQMNCVTNYTETAWNGQLKGRHITSEGTLKVLFIFAQFPDDMYDNSNSTWIKGQQPNNMNNWVDSTWNTSATTGFMTDYFNDMSFDKLKFIGKEVSVITPHSRQWYLDNSKSRGFIHREIIQDLDLTWDFAEFDNWNYEGEYNHINQPDSVVDMIFFVWRNIAHEYSYPQDSIIYVNLDMGRVATIGGSEFTVDNGLRVIKTSYGGSGTSPSGSGVTLTDWFNEDMFRFSIHEFGHYFFGGNSYHVGHGFWGLLSGWGVKSYVANAYERYRLGWINLNTIQSTPEQTISNATLPDYITTGVAYRFVVDSLTSKYFYLENHQKQSIWETTKAYSEATIENGIYILRQDATSGENTFIKCMAADGRYNYTVNQRIQSQWGWQILPVFKKLNPDRRDGYTDQEYIPWYWNGVSQGSASIHYVEDPSTGQPVVNVEHWGEGTDAFRMDYNQMFSPYSNPNSQNIGKNLTPFGFYINGYNEQGVANLDIYVGTAINGPPSKPHLGAFHAGDGPIYYGWAYLAWGADYWDGQPIESDINWSELQRKINNNGSWVTVYSGPNRWWSDNSIIYDPENGNIPVFFRVRLRDIQNKWSIWSDQFDTRAFFKAEGNFGIEKKQFSQNILPTSNELSANYPNPFNPSTVINYAVKEAGIVKIKVFDILGSEVADLVNESKEAGNFVIEFNASNLPSGVYIYTMQVNNFSSSQKMLLLK